MSLFALDEVVSASPSVRNRTSLLARSVDNDAVSSG